jgi:aminoglycoside phosphotransferase (APT) family kinase protein
MSLNAAGVRKISDDTLVKVTVDSGEAYVEAASFDLVRMHTTIPIPRIRRKFKDESNISINVMDYIPGERLDRVWPSLSLWSKLWVALTLRRYIRELRQIKDSHSSVPGPIADSPQKCDGYLFFDRICGPFPDYASLTAFYNNKLEISKGAHHIDEHGITTRYAPPDSEPFDDTKPLVFTHGDLSMRNIIYGRDGRIWLVDLGRSGFYPRWFEYVSMVYASENDVAPDSWNRLIPFIADPFFKHIRWIGLLGVAFISYH